MEVSIEQVGISARFFTTMKESFASDLGQQPVFVHDTPTRLAVVMLTILPLHPYLCSEAAIGMHKAAAVLASIDLFQ